jgi:hypothetical protein
VYSKNKKSVKTISNKKSNETQNNVKTTYIKRNNKMIETDNVFEAWTSGNLHKMLEVINTPTNILDRHHLLQAIVNITYKDRKNETNREICKQTAILHLDEMDNIIKSFKENPLHLDDNGTCILPRISTFQHYATVLTEDLKYNEAIEVCKKAINYGLHDNTKGGYEGRINRIKKKI